MTISSQCCDVSKQGYLRLVVQQHPFIMQYCLHIHKELPHMKTNAQFMQAPKCVPTVRHTHTHTHSSCKVSMQYPVIPASKRMMYFYGKADKETPLLPNLVHHKLKIKLPQL